jgi:hypothetical protein
MTFICLNVLRFDIGWLIFIVAVGRFGMAGFF